MTSYQEAAHLLWTCRLCCGLVADLLRRSCQLVTDLLRGNWCNGFWCRTRRRAKDGENKTVCERWTHQQNVSYSAAS